MVTESMRPADTGDSAGEPVLCRTRLVVAAGLMLSTPCLALAQGASSNGTADSDTAQLETVIVNAYRSAQTVGAATKTDTPLIETPQSVSVVTRDEMDARGVENLNEATRYNAGVLAESQGIDNRVDDVYIRGFNAGSFGNNVMLDGLRALNSGGTGWNRSMFDVWGLERVEVLKGPSAVMYGQVAPGGMVNRVSKLPTLNQSQILQAGLDIYGKYELAADLGSSTDDGNVLWRLAAKHSDGNTQIDHVSTRRELLAPSVTFEFNGGATELTLLGNWMVDNGGSTFQFLPYEGTIEPAAEGYIDNTTFLGEPDWNVYDRNQWSAGWLLSHKINSEWSLQQGARYMHIDSRYRTTVGGTSTLEDDRILGRRAVQGDGDSDGWSADTRLVGHLGSGAVKHTVLAGVDLQKEDWTFLRQYAKVSTSDIAIDVFDPVYTYYDFASVLADQISTSETDRQTGVYLQDQVAVDRWHFSLGGRYDWAKMDSLNRLTDVGTKTDNKAFTMRGGVLYRLNKEWAPYVSYSESFLPATGTDRDGNAFDPTTGVQWEAGFKYQPSSIDGMVTVSAYDLRQQNILTADPENDADESYQVQSGEVRVRGLELEGRVTPLDGFSIIGAVTRSDSDVTKNNDGNQGNRMIRVPDWMGSLWLDYGFQAGALQGLSVAGGARYVGQTYGDLANSLSIPSYTLWDAALRYDLGQVGRTNVRFAVNGSNLADKRYVATCSAATACFYGSGRTVMATARVSW